MKVLMINGSPHKNGSTYTALTIIGEELKKYDIDYEIMWVGNKAISGCIACSSCKQTGKCFVDDIVNEFMEKGKTCDGFVFGSPVYYASATGQITSFMDRLFMVGRQSMKYKPSHIFSKILHYLYAFFVFHNFFRSSSYHHIPISRRNLYHIAYTNVFV